MSPALNPMALAAATLSLGAHAAVFGVLIFNPADEPSDVLYLVNIVTASAQPSPLMEPQAAAPAMMPAPLELPAEEQTAESQITETRETMPAQPVVIEVIPSRNTQAPTILAAPKTKPVAHPSGLASIAIVEPTDIARVDPAPTRQSPRSAPTIETEIAVAPGNAQPHYPLVARRRGYEGQAIVRVQVSETGKVLSVTIASSSGHEVLDLAARDAVTDWQFQPATRDGQPTVGLIEVPIKFRLR